MNVDRSGPTVPVSEATPEAAIRLIPKGFCSSNYLARGLPGGDAEIRFDGLTEQGWIVVGERELRVRKHGPASGTWSVEFERTEFMMGRKPSALSRRMEIECAPSVGALPQLFAFWMVGLMRKRAAAAAAS